MDLKQTTQQQIYQICNELSENLESLLEKFDIEFKKNGDSYSFSCPVHGGDNHAGCSVLTNGVWSCWTHGCHDQYKKTLFGFVRGVLSHRKGKKATMTETINFCLSFLNKSQIEAPAINLDLKFETSIFEAFNKKIERISTGITRQQVRRAMFVPSVYFQNRNPGFSKEVLDQFDVGDCHNPEKEMFNRAVAPVYDENWGYVGCIGRSLVENPTVQKWKNNKGFSKSLYLYGLNIAKEHIIKKRAAILVEGQGDVWRCHEAGYKNTVGMFGCDLSDEQLILLESSGCCNLVVLTDNDNAGNDACEKIIKKCGRRFNYFRPILPLKDPGECSVQQIKELLGSFKCLI
jgi:DNA primase